MRVACVQSNVVYADPMANAASAAARIGVLASQGVDLAIFPECFLTGYCVDTAEEARRISIGLDHPSMALIAEACKAREMHCVVGYAGREGETVYNGACLIEPNGKLSEYRKSHLPELGFDKFVVAGDDLPVFDTSLGKIGMAICFDLRPPEVVRCLALKGAELVVLPTNWPEGAEFAPDHMAGVRANENRVFLAACNRVGTENGFTFIGKSAIWDITGKPLAAAQTGDEVIVADIDLARAREKRVRIIPGKYETTIFESRRPDLYGVLTDK